MIVQLHRSPIRPDFDVHVADDRHRLAAVLEDGRLVWREVAENEEWPVFVRLPPEVLEALARAAANVVPATDATVEALADTRMVRDRLLAIVECGTRSETT